MLTLRACCSGPAVIGVGVAGPRRAEAQGGAAHNRGAAPGQHSTVSARALDPEGLAGAQVGLGEAEREAVLRTVAAVLHLGNIQFAPAADEGAAPVGVASAEAIAAVADLLEARRPSF